MDIHQVANDWKNTCYPSVCGHEVIGKIVKAGHKISKFEEVDNIVGVVCMLDSCQTCAQCKNDEEQFCLGDKEPTMTYDGYFGDPKSNYNTFGSFSCW
ncbi:alcohol dehydrogenase catalytic domain-containing protein [Polaribacter vadi]|uniref:alcohol dehydrogenase catalytic domain-containing protein n=1 Tax=Polaribacter vadi TaxID=1774273 RepID=UPI003C6E437E